MMLPSLHPVRVSYDVLADRLGLSPADRVAERVRWRSSGTRPLRRLVAMTSLEQVHAAFYEAIGVPAIDISSISPAAWVAAKVPPVLTEQGLAAAIDIDSTGKLVIAVSDPFDYALARRLDSILAGQEVRYVRASPDQIRTVRCDGGPTDDGAFARLISTDITAEDATEDEAGDEEPERGPHIGEQLVEQIFERAVGSRATDVHLVPYRDLETGLEGLKVRFRIDGTAHRQPDLCISGRRGLRAADIVARTLRIVGGATAMSSATQDFRVYREVDGRQICGRVHTRPADLGGATRNTTAQMTAIRVLDSRVRRLEELGFSKETIDTWLGTCRSSGNLSLVSGPTGSGKTTLLAATVPAVVDEGEIAYSIEDPVEYHHSLLIQMEIQAANRDQRREHMTSVLYELMRETPDFVMVGEIRDRDSMDLAFELALRGAQVMTTMHAGSAVHAVQRLLEWGLDPFIVATNLGAVLNVRLLRRLCRHCRIEVTHDDGDAVWPKLLHGHELPDVGYKKSDQGCPACHHNGTVGQFGIAELLGMEGVTVERLKDSTSVASLMAGRRSLEDEAVAALSQGETDLRSVLQAHIGPGAGAAASRLDEEAIA
jgi:type II secretory ATPase GspE/PulE/Tfp pilus assembly ATPase PilB-like protein